MFVNTHAFINSSVGYKYLGGGGGRVGERAGETFELGGNVQGFKIMKIILYVKCTKIWGFKKPRPHSHLLSRRLSALVVVVVAAAAAADGLLL